MCVLWWGRDMLMCVHCLSFFVTSHTHCCQRLTRHFSPLPPPHPFQELALLRKLFFKHRNALDTILHIGSPLEDGKVCVVMFWACFL